MKQVFWGELFERLCVQTKKKHKKKHNEVLSMLSWLSTGDNFSSPGWSGVVKRFCFFSSGILYIYCLDLSDWLTQNTSSRKTPDCISSGSTRGATRRLDTSPPPQLRKWRSLLHSYLISRFALCGIFFFHVLTIFVRNFYRPYPKDGGM